MYNFLYSTERAEEYGEGANKGEDKLWTGIFYS